MTTMTIAGHLSSSNPSLSEIDLTGKFDVYGTELSNGMLTLNETEGGYLSATYDDTLPGFGDWVYTDAKGTWLLNLTKQ